MAKSHREWKCNPPYARLHRTISAVVKATDKMCCLLWQGQWRNQDQTISKSPIFSIPKESIWIYSHHGTYACLGHKFNVAGDWKEQLSELHKQMGLIDSAPLPIMMKMQDIREVLAKIQHLFTNPHIPVRLLIPQHILTQLNNKTVQQWFGLNTHSTRDIIFVYQNQPPTQYV